MTVRFSLGIPILIVGLGMGALFALPVAMFGVGNDESAAKETCNGQVSLKAEKALMIFTGTVEMTLDEKEWQYVWLRPKTWYKGKTTTATIMIAQPKSNAESSAMSSGNTVFLFFLRRGESGKLTTNKCYGTRVLGEGLTRAEIVAFKL